MKAPFRLLLLLALLLLGLFVRVDDLRDWRRTPEAALYEGEPLLLTYDGYYYLRLARDLVEGTYEPIDDLRGVPTPPPRPTPPPLLSLLLAALVRLTPLSLLWAGALVPPLLGLLLAFPVYAWGRRLGGRSSAFIAVLFALLGSAYVERTTLGRLDTDCLNVFFAFASAYGFLRFAEASGRGRYTFLSLALGASVLYLLWWDSAPFVAAGVAFFPALIALLFFYRPAPQARLAFYGSLAALLLIALLWFGFDLPLRFLGDLRLRYAQVFGRSEGAYPEVGRSISELGRPSFGEIVRATTNSLPGLVLAVAGILLLVWKRRREASFLAIPLLLSVVTPFSKRMLIYFVPMCALGLGYLASLLWNAGRPPRPIRYAAPVVALLLAIPLIRKDMVESSFPMVFPPIVSGMRSVSEVTPPDAVVWAYWDAGYPISYWSRRGTFLDGGLALGGRPLYNAIPFAAESPREAANFIRFFAARGAPGMDLLIEAEGSDAGAAISLARRALSAGPIAARDILEKERLLPAGGLITPDDWLRFFYPRGSRPLYLWFDARLLETCYWLLWFGTWDPGPEKGYEAFFRSFWSVREEAGRIVSPQITVDPRTGEFRREHAERPGRLAELRVHDRRGSRTTTYPGGSDFVFDFHPLQMHGALQDARISRSLFSTLFLRAEGDSAYFLPVALEFPSYQLWEVRADTLVP